MNAADSRYGIPSEYIGIIKGINIRVSFIYNLKSLHYKWKH